MVYIAGINLVKDEEHKRCIEHIVNDVEYVLRLSSANVRVRENEEEIIYIVRLCFECNYFYEMVLNTHNIKSLLYNGIYGVGIIEEIKKSFLFNKGLTRR